MKKVLNQIKTLFKSKIPENVLPTINDLRKYRWTSRDLNLAD